jgi:hypothetical protein
LSERRQNDPEVPRLAGPVNSLLFGTNFAVARQLPSPAPGEPTIISTTSTHVNVELLRVFKEFGGSTAYGKGTVVSSYDQFMFHPRMRRPRCVSQLIRDLDRGRQFGVCYRSCSQVEIHGRFDAHE